MERLLFDIVLAREIWKYALAALDERHSITVFGKAKRVSVRRCGPPRHRRTQGTLKREK